MASNCVSDLLAMEIAQAGPPCLPRNIRELIRQMAQENPTLGEERMADELLLKLGIRVSPRTLRKYLEANRPRGGRGGQCWSTFVRNIAKEIVACDFMVCVTATFRIIYVFVAMEVGSRRILHLNVTEHPTAAWTIQQFREFLAFDHPYRFLIHDRDKIFSAATNEALKGFGVRVLKTPIRAPKANAFCERLIGTIRRECLDYLIPINQRHLKSVRNDLRQSLQPRPASFIVRTWHSVAISGHSSGRSVPPQAAQGISRYSEARSRRLTP